MTDGSALAALDYEGQASGIKAETPARDAFIVVAPLRSDYEEPEPEKKPTLVVVPKSEEPVSRPIPRHGYYQCPETGVEYSGGMEIARTHFSR